MLDSCRDDIVRERTRCYNCLNDLIHQVCPPLEEVFSKKDLYTDFSLVLLARYGDPKGLRRSVENLVTRWVSSLKYQKTRGPAKGGDAFNALAGMTVMLPATSTYKSTYSH